MKKRYGIAVAFATLSVLNGGLRALIFLPILGWTLYLINEIEKTKKNSSSLSTNEKIQVIITEFLSPVVAGGFYYYCLKDKYPKKANQANKYSFIALGIEVLVGIIFLVITFSSGH